MSRVSKAAWRFTYRRKFLDSLVRGVEEEAKQAAERKRLLEKESGELQQQADELAEEIRELSGESTSRIV